MEDDPSQCSASLTPATYLLMDDDPLLINCSIDAGNIVDPMFWY